MTDNHERLREAYQAVNAFGKDSYVMLISSDLGALLDERDTLAAEAQEQARLLGISAERELQLKAERDALREALELMVEMIEMNGFGFHYVMDVARTTLAQGKDEHRDSGHR